MDGKAWGLAVEMTFVLTALAVLKEWVFPFFIWSLFPAGDAAAWMLEWMMLMVSVITVFIYLGLGSSAKHHHDLGVSRAAAVFFLLHVPVFLGLVLGKAHSFFSVFHWLFLQWEGLIGGGFDLFANSFSRTVHPVALFGFTTGLFFLGRGIRVRENHEPDPVVQPNSAVRKRKRSL